MKRFRTTIISTTVVVITSILLFSQSSYARPTAIPPGDNIPGAPLFLDGSTSTKSGNLTVSNTVTANSSATVTGTTSASTICLNGSCSGSWPNLNRPNWTFNQVVGAGPYVYGGYMQLGGIQMLHPNGSYRQFTYWPTFTVDGYTGSQQTIPPYSFCNWTNIMQMVNWDGFGFLQSANCYTSDYWPN